MCRIPSTAAKLGSENAPNREMPSHTAGEPGTFPHGRGTSYSAGVVASHWLIITVCNTLLIWGVGFRDKGVGFGVWGSADNALSTKPRCNILQYLNDFYLARIWP